MNTKKYSKAAKGPKVSIEELKMADPCSSTATAEVIKNNITEDIVGIVTEDTKKTV